MSLDAVKRKVSLELSPKLLSAIEDMRKKLGLERRGQVVEQVLNEYFFGSADEK